MALNFGSTAVKKLIYNGTEIKKLIYNGTQVWTSEPDLTFVAIPGRGSNNPMYSLDNCQTWTYGNTGPNNYSAKLTFGLGKFVVYNYGSSSIYYSSDGISWVNVTTPAVFTGIASSGSKMVATTSAGTVYYSSNVTSWTKATGVPSGTYLRASMNLPMYGEGYFICGNQAAPTHYSTDGNTWIKIPSRGSGIDLCYGNGYFTYGRYNLFYMATRSELFNNATPSKFVNIAPVDTDSAESDRTAAYGGGYFYVASGDTDYTVNASTAAATRITSGRGRYRTRPAYDGDKRFYMSNYYYTIGASSIVSFTPNPAMQPNWTISNRWQKGII